MATQGTQVKHSPEDLKAIFDRVGRGTTAAAAAAGLEPFLFELKEQTWQELIFAPKDPLILARIAGKAEILDALQKTFFSAIEDGKAATQELQGGN